MPMYRSDERAVFFLLAATTRCEKSWVPSADIYRSHGGWLIKLDLAGVCEDDVTVAASGNQLTVSGCRRDPIVAADWSHYSMEIAYSRFERILELPCKLDLADLRIELREGMLLIHVIPRGEGP